MGQGAFLFLFCLYREPKIRLWLFATCQTPYYPRYTTNNHLRSVDTHFHDGVGSVSLCLLRIQAAKHSFMTVCNLSNPILPKIHDNQSLTLHWRSFSRWGRMCFCCSFAYKRSQWFVYNCWQAVAPNNTQDTGPTIVDTPLTLIFKLRQGGYSKLFCPNRRPMIALGLTATNRWCDYPGRRTNNRWRSIDANFQDKVESMSLWFLAIKAANTSIMYNQTKLIFNYHTYMT